MKITWKEYLIKAFIIAGLFVGMFFLARALGWPALFDSHIYLDGDFQFKALVCLIIYRVTIYFIFPFIIAAIEKFYRKDKYWHLVLKNFNIQFFAYSLISGLYLVVGLDKMLGVSIFASADALMFLASFAFTLILGKQVDNNVQQ